MKNLIGIIGGSGFYDFLEGEEMVVNTPYGAPSDKILLSEYQGRGVAFLPRHGKNHQYPPHQINYRANLFALKKLGVSQVLAPCAVGSLNADMAPGDFVIADQLIDQTKNRKDTFFDGPKAVHISMAEPYCHALRQYVILGCDQLDITCHDKGTLLVVEGPRFSTKAESRLYGEHTDIINMTQYPEAVLARELEMCYANISIVTDYDAGLASSEGVEPVSASEVKQVFTRSNEKLKQLILRVVGGLPKIPSCACQVALKDAVL